MFLFVLFLRKYRRVSFNKLIKKAKLTIQTSEVVNEDDPSFIPIIHHLPQKMAEEVSAIKITGMSG